MPSLSDTRTHILDVAQGLMQQCGFNAVSYADIGKQLGIRNASIHHHFPSKAELGTELARRYRQRVKEVLLTLSAAELSPASMLEQYVAAYHAVIHGDGRICLCTALAGDYGTLPEAMQREVQSFFALNERWLTDVLRQGQNAGHFRLSESPRDTALGLLATLEGAMLLARVRQEPPLFFQVMDRSLRGLQTA